MTIQAKVIFWDFDGVIMDSMSVRDKGFRVVLNDFPSDKVEQLMSFHRMNGGLSRYVKFKYFLEEVLHEPVSEQRIAEWANRFSKVMRETLTNPDLLIKETIEFIKSNYEHLPMHIVSGSDQSELRFLCKELGIDQYFLSIHGSPTPKKQLVREILKTFGYPMQNTALIGDSTNDWDAANENGIIFFGYNNQSLRDKYAYIESFKTLFIQ